MAQRKKPASYRYDAGRQFGWEAADETISTYGTSLAYDHLEHLRRDQNTDWDKGYFQGYQDRIEKVPRSKVTT